MTSQKEQALLKEKIKSYWSRINNIEKRIDNLAHHNVDYQRLLQKRINLLRNVKILDKRKEKK